MCRRFPSCNTQGARGSLADFELVSKEFATAVWDNTRTKDILNQDNPEPCERIPRSSRRPQNSTITRPVADAGTCWL